MNDHYHRPKREIIQKVMEAGGEDPQECVSQAYLDRYSELDTVRDVFRALRVDPDALSLRLCKDDPPDCQAFDEAGNLVGWEVVGLYDQHAEAYNAKAKTIREIVYRDWTEEDLASHIASVIQGKIEKVAKKKSASPHWPFAYVNLVIVTDELAITCGMAESMRGRAAKRDATAFRDVYLLLGYDPNIEARPCFPLLPKSGM